MDNTFLDLPMDDEDCLLPLQSASISCRIAVGPDKDKIVLALQTLPEKDDDNYGHLAQIGGFSLLVREFADSHESEKLERLCRYMYWSKPDILVWGLSGCSVREADLGAMNFPSQRPVD